MSIECPSLPIEKPAIFQPFSDGPCTAEYERARPGTTPPCVTVVGGLFTLRSAGRRSEKIFFTLLESWGRCWPQAARTPGHRPHIKSSADHTPTVSRSCASSGSARGW